MKIAGFLGIAAACGFVSTSANACQTDPYYFKWGTDSSSHMAVRTGESCKFGFNVNAKSHMDSVAVAQPPQHGTLQQVDPTHWMYRPARGYAGQDQMVIKASGSFMGGRGVLSGESAITWAVDVSP